jgi:predicted nucleic acid-binding protein
MARSGRDPVFFDTNVLVYIFGDHPEKQARAEALFYAASEDGTATVSTQVLNEFYVVATRKVERPLPHSTARLGVAELSRQNLVELTARLILKAADRADTDNLSHWDALIVEAALAGGCRTLYSEDLQPGRKFGPLRVVNPFSAK